MQTDVGVSGSALSWLKSYFVDRHQSVSVSGMKSKKAKMGTGFPQGSQIGPFGFCPYTAPLIKIAHKYGIEIHLYADERNCTYVSTEKIIGRL